MGYKRANWHSGLVYVQTCEECKQVVNYTDHSLGFRPWYPDGFVYCPKCQTPLRHNEKYAINGASQEVNQENNCISAEENIRSEKPLQENNQFQIQTTDSGNARSKFCPKCGKAFNAEDNFCSGCGQKRI